MVTTKKDSKDFWKMIEEIESKKGPNDLEEQIRVLSFRNEKLHTQNEKQGEEIKELRADNKRLARQVEDLLLEKEMSP